LGYQPAMQGSCGGKTTGMFGEAAMSEQWDSVDKVVMGGTHKAQKGASSGVTCSHWR
jgi:hypothetical protein